MRGAPHYYILLWIENAPAVGIDRPEDVCSFIQDRITCHIPDSNTSLDLNSFGNKIPNAQVQQILQATMRERMWEKFYKLQSSHEFTAMWTDFLRLSN